MSTNHSKRRKLKKALHRLLASMTKIETPSTVLLIKTENIEYLHGFNFGPGKLGVIGAQPSKGKPAC